MYILDAVIIVGFIIGILGGIRRGLIKSGVLLVGLVLILMISFYLKNPISAFFYKSMPFISFKLLPPIYNIVLYELIAFLVIFSVLYLVLRIILKITGILEKLLDLTIILGFFSKIGGAIIGFIEAYIVIFILLFLFSQPFMHITGVEDSVLTNKILDSSPILSSYITDARNAFKEVDDLKDKYGSNTKEYNKEVINVFLKYNIISRDNLDVLIEKGKIDY